MVRRIRLDVVVGGSGGYRLFDHPCLVLQALPFVSVCTENEKMVAVYIELEPMVYKALYRAEREAGFLYFTLDKFTGEEKPKTYIRKITVYTKGEDGASRFGYEIELEGGFFGKASAVARTMDAMLRFEKPNIRRYLARAIKEASSGVRGKTEETPAEPPVEMKAEPVKKEAVERTVDETPPGKPSGVSRGGYRYDLCDPLVRYRIMKGGEKVASLELRSDRVVKYMKSYSMRGGVYYAIVRGEGGGRMYLLVELGDVLGYCNQGITVEEPEKCTVLVYRVDEKTLKELQS